MEEPAMIRKVLSSVAAAATLSALTSGPTLAQNAPPRLIPMGCNYDGRLSWLAVGRASAGPELDSFRVEVPGVDLDRVEAAQISPSGMHMYTPYVGPLVSPLRVTNTAITLRHDDGVPNGNIVTVGFNIASADFDPAVFREAGAIAYVLVLNSKSIGCTRGP
jgi:hypothetical protein